MNKQFLGTSGIEISRLSYGCMRISGSWDRNAVDDAVTARAIGILEAAVDAVLAVAVLDAYQKQAPGYRRLQPPQVLAGLPRSPLGKLRRADALAALISGARA